ncbi:glycoside hydrolase family 18 protein [Fictibacillus iocasae]|uniref:Glycoside hydrolase family 18 protein n=1 Tax=Fictibacillus iocasae TaxID=2715437 RepID=A0ABW2NJE4_9BACL
MQIHVVKRGDSLWELSRFYRLPWQEIAVVNGLGANDILTVGQTLFIPSPFVYTVKQGDTFESISEKIGISASQLQSANPGVQQLMTGLQLNVPQRPKRTITTNAFAEPTPKSRANFKNAAKALSYITLFSYEVNEKGELTSLDDEAFLKEIRNENVRPVMAITNIKGGEFSEEVGTAILRSEKVTNTLIDNVLTTMKQKGYTGLSVDFEYLGKKNKEPYNQFLRRVTERMHAAGYVVMTALAPKIKRDQKGEWYESHDYRAHGQIVDYVILMTYEWGYSGGPPLPVSPITQVRKVLDYAVSEIPRNKILMGINLYGYDWKLPYKKGNPFAKAMSPVQSVQLAGKRKAAIQYDTKEQSPYFTYYDKEKKQHIVWFEDLRSMKAKFDLIDEYKLAGASFWNLAFNYPVLWNFLVDRYDIKYQ